MGSVKTEAKKAAALVNRLKMCLVVVESVAELGQASQEALYRATAKHWTFSQFDLALMKLTSLKVLRRSVNEGAITYRTGDKWAVFVIGQRQSFGMPEYDFSKVKSHE